MKTAFTFDCAGHPVAITKLAPLAFAGLLCLGLTACCTGSSPGSEKRTCSSFDLPTHRARQPEFASGVIYLQNASLEQVLTLYQEISGRTVIRGALPSPPITVRNQTPLTRIQALQLLDTVLAQNGIAMVLAGDTAVKAVPNATAPSESPPEITLPWEALPDSGSFMSRTVQLKRVRAVEVIPALQPLVKTPNALLAYSSPNLLVIRDYSSNVRRILEMLQTLEKNAGP